VVPGPNTHYVPVQLDFTARSLSSVATYMARVHMRNWWLKLPMLPVAENGVRNSDVKKTWLRTCLGEPLARVLWRIYRLHGRLFLEYARVMSFDREAMSYKVFILGTVLHRLIQWVSDVMSSRAHVVKD